MNISEFFAGFFRGHWGQVRVLFLLLGAFFIFETYLHNSKYDVAAPSQSLDWPFSRSCRPQFEAEAPAHVHQPRENATILILARNSELNETASSIRSLEEQFNKDYHYPYVFLNDVEWDPAFEAAMREETTSELTFETIPKEMWSWPPDIDQDAAKASWAKMERQGLPHVSQVSYHHMCRFYSGFFYDHPALTKYKYFWRVEPDVSFSCQIPYDPFLAMRKTDKVYGYTIALWEVGSTCPSLFRTTADFKKEKAIPTTSLWTSLMEASWAPLPLRWFLMPFFKSRDDTGDGWNHCHFWSNFEIADLDFFRSQEYRSYFERLDQAGGFYTERWGDAPIHTLGLALFADPKQIHYFEDIGYRHGKFQHCPPEEVGCNCTCEQGNEVDRTCLDRFRSGVT